MLVSVLLLFSFYCVSQSRARYNNFLRSEYGYRRELKRNPLILLAAIYHAGIYCNDVRPNERAHKYSISTCTYSLRIFDRLPSASYTHNRIYMHINTKWISITSKDNYFYYIEDVISNSELRSESDCRYP